MNKKTTLNNFRKNFKNSFSQRSSVSFGSSVGGPPRFRVSHGSNGPSGSLMSHSFRGPRGCNGTRGSCVFCISKSTFGSKGLCGVIFFF